MSEQEYSPPSQQELDQLTGEIAALIKYQRRHYMVNKTLYIALISFSIIGSGIIALAGFADQGIIAAILGVAVGISVGLQDAFAYSEKAEFKAIIVTAAINLQTDVKFKIKSREAFDRAIDQLKSLHLYAWQNIPRGQGIEAAATLKLEMSNPTQSTPGTLPETR